MATCNTSELLASAACFDCASPGVQNLYKLALLCNIAQSLDPDMTCDPSTLLADAACFACLSPGVQRLIELQLLCNISSSISGGVVPAEMLTCGTGAPTSTPSLDCAFYIDKTLGAEALYIWNGSAWVLKV